MSKEIESIASALFDKIRSRFPNLTLGDESAKACQDPEKARFFNFTYTSNPANGTPEKFGNVTISLIDEQSLRVYYGMNMASDMDDAVRNDWYHFLRGLRQFAKRNLLTFDTRDIDKSSLELKDIKQQAKVDDVAVEKDISVTESRLYGNASRPKLSTGEHGATKLLVMHSEKVDEEKRGARTRKIERIYLETPIGERFLINSKSLRIAYAMAEHLNQGGRCEDDRGKHIIQLGEELKALQKFARATRNRQFEDDTTQDAVRKALHDYQDTKRKINLMSRGEYYKNYFENIGPLDITAQTAPENLDELREKFAIKKYDPRIEETLPIIASKINELESWVEEISEGTWASPDTPVKVEALKHLFSAPILASRATDDLGDLIGDDELFDQIDVNYKHDQPDYDVRPIVRAWLKHNMPEIAGQLGGEDGIGNHDFVQPASPKSAQTPDYGATSLDEPVVESDSLAFIKILAGL